MDPISALNIAAAIVQFIDFTGKLIKDYGEIRHTGQPLTYEAFQQTTNDLLKLNSTLKDRTKTNSPSYSPNIRADDSEKALGKILDECSQIANRLVETLRSLRPKKIDRAEIEAITMAADEIASLRSRLSILQEQLVLRVLACINAKVDHYAAENSRRFDGLEETGTKVVEIVSFNQGEMKKLRSDFDDSLEVIKKHHGDVIAAILTLSGVLKLGHPSYKSQTSPYLEEFSFSRLHKNILDWLYFRQITDRVDNLSDAHRQTFNWIFQKRSHHKPWPDFPRWLREGSGCYWLNGKAGSGKSILMKYIWQEERTWDHLRNWFGASRPLSASFYFWNLGGNLQKTQNGLLRSLLYDVLKKYADLIPMIMPEICRDVHALPSLGTEEPTLNELRRYFKRLLDQASSQCRMFFLIDGIDEYEGDYTDLIDLIKSASSVHVKFLISSRPITACTEAFSSMPGLRLHDLTRGDMRNYATDLLQKRLKKRGDSWLQLIEDLVEKSSGVFLWLALVVRSLIHGLRDGDSLSELQTRLDELPSDLADLYAHMLNKIPPRYRRQASYLFQIFMKSMSVERDIRGHPLLAIQLSFTDHSWATVQSTPCHPIKKKEERIKYEQMDSRIRSRCCGLLEFQERKSLRQRGEPRAHFARPHLEFIHKTAAEFLRDKDVWSRVKGWSDSNPYMALMQSCIMLIKTTKPADVVHLRYSLVWDSMYAALHYAQLAENEGAEIPVAYLEELDKSLMVHWTVADKYIKPFATEPQAHWSSIFFWDRQCEGTEWTQETKNCDNNFRGLGSIHDESSLIEGSEDIGFNRVIIVYSLRSYLKRHFLTQNHIVSTDQSTMRFWLGLLTSTFPLRLRMPATYQFSLSLLQTAVESTCILNDEFIIVIWKIFLIELCSSRDLKTQTAEEGDSMEELILALFRKRQPGSKVLYQQAAQLLTPRLPLLYPQSYVTATVLRSVESWLKNQQIDADKFCADVTTHEDRNKDSVGKIKDQNTHSMINMFRQIRIPKARFRSPFPKWEAERIERCRNAF
ncbi:hypothetical protein F5Y19DRAFT_463421 [Xylariaceae sp. FL1651]|nr:hypothetical protein F5Y19DRAFT_463421 [Xylariaceae sp. FL1651]